MVGFTNWKKTTEKFANHEKSDLHRICCEAVLCTVDVGRMLNQQVVTEKHPNNDCLLKILSTVCFLAQQGLALRGDKESNSILHQLLHLHGKDYPELISFLDKKN